jgi:catechol 2,3-dioxygenase-like lactoylglutathione lyase family enzyme
MVHFEGSIPILAVRDLAASVRYYVDVLGFKMDWQELGAIAAVSRDRCEVFLVEGDRGIRGHGCGSG